MTGTQILTAYQRISPNFITPSKVALRLIPEVNTAVELATGTGLTGSAMYSVSVMVFGADGNRIAEGKFRSRPFFRLDEAREYYDSIIDKLERV